MERRLPHNIRLGRASGRTQAAAALLEVLVALFVLGIGLLALLTVFPLGALAMAKAIQDDRTATFANDAVAFGQAGEELILRTKDFVEASLSSGSVDRDATARLRDEYEDYIREAAAPMTRDAESRGSVLEMPVSFFAIAWLRGRPDPTDPLRQERPAGTRQASQRHPRGGGSARRTPWSTPPPCEAGTRAAPILRCVQFRQATGFLVLRPCHFGDPQH
jgi:hypothetical protein